MNCLNILHEWYSICGSAGEESIAMIVVKMEGSSL
jgi:hypothetical protein